MTNNLENSVNLEKKKKTDTNRSQKYNQKINNKTAFKY